MNNNDVLRRLRYALNIGNSSMREIFALAGHDFSESDMLEMMSREGDADYVECRSALLSAFLDGLIISRRGKREGSPANSDKFAERISNNMILKKLKIAMNFKDTDIIDLLVSAGYEINKSELSALFRKRGHKNYKVCGDQILKRFLEGMTVRFRNTQQEIQKESSCENISI